MGTLVFDIETVGERWQSVDEHTKNVLTRWAKKSAKNESEEKVLTEDIKNSLGFSPYTGEIVALGLYDVERTQGVVYFQSNEKDVEFGEGNFVFRSRTEKEMLEDFWDGVQSYDTFVSYNGRGFDVPFINIRSAKHEIRPTHDLMQGRYLNRQEEIFHVDLQDQLTYYNAVHRKPSLHIVCRAFGIESPKVEGEEGDDVAKLYEAGRFKKIAKYNARDVVATTELYEKWLQYLAPYSFINRIS